MKTSSNVTKIMSALLAAQRGMGAVVKDAKNPYFKSNYADYGSVLGACKDLLNEKSVVILQPHVWHDGKNFVETTLVHDSGEWISSETEVVCSKQNDPQALGSAITYARRYGLQSLLAMPTEDDDGEKAMTRTTTTKSLPDRSLAPTSSVEATKAIPEAAKPKTTFRKPPPATTSATTTNSSGFGD